MRTPTRGKDKAVQPPFLAPAHSFISLDIFLQSLVKQFILFFVAEKQANTHK
jgi:hypothetical protein